jgi:hypothetical protein
MSFQTLTRLLHFCADRIEQSEKPGPFTQNPTQSQETLNSKPVASFLQFPTGNYMPSYGKQSKSYEFLNIIHVDVSLC